MKVEIRRGSNLGVFIHEEIITGTVIKVNKKSLRVHMTHAKCTTNGKVVREYDMNVEATFVFWKTIERESGKNAGKTVSLYKSQYGIIEIVH